MDQNSPLFKDIEAFQSIFYTLETIPTISEVDSILQRIGQKEVVEMIAQAALYRPNLRMDCLELLKTLENDQKIQHNYIKSAIPTGHLLCAKLL